MNVLTLQNQPTKDIESSPITNLKWTRNEPDNFTIYVVFILY